MIFDDHAVAERRRVFRSAISCSCVMRTTVMFRSRFQLLEDAHHLDAGFRVEVPGGFVGQRIDGSLMSARAIATRCC